MQYRAHTTRSMVLLLLLAAMLAAFPAPTQASPPAGYYLVWGDEFNGTALDTNKWDYWLPGKWNNAYNTANAVSLNGSNLVITTYTSGNTNFTAMLASEHHFRPRYGFYEASIQWGDTNGMWSAFWLRSPTMGTYLDDSFVSGAELDVAEHRYVGIYNTNIANIVSCNIHWNGYGAAEQSSGSPNVGSGLATGFHTYSLLWAPHAYVFNIDDALVWDGTSTTPPFGSDVYALLSSEANYSNTLWAGSYPAGGFGSQANSSVKMTVDYFRYYAPTNVLFWTGASSPYWTNAANWVANLAPEATSDLTFSYLTSTPTNILGRDYAIDGLVFLGTTNSISINGPNTLTLGGGGIDMVAADHNVTLNAPVSLGSDQRWTIGRNAPGNLLTVNASLSGKATLTKAGYGTLVLNGTNNFSGTFYLDTGSSNTNDGIVTVTSSAVIAQVASPLSIRNTGTAVSTLQLANGVLVPQNVSLAGRNTNVAAIETLSGSGNTLANGLTLTGGGSYYGLQCDAGALTLAGTIAPSGTATGLRTLTLQGGGDFLVSGSIQNGSASALNLFKANAGTLTLSGANTYTGTTTNCQGTLLVNGSLAGPVVVTGGILSGAGTLGGDTSLAAGELSPGSASVNAIGTLSFGGNLTLGPGTATFLELNAAAQTNDQLKVAGTLTLGGTLVVSNQAGTLAAGQSFRLFNAGRYAGGFSGFSLPWLNHGLAWNTDGLTNGLLSIVTVPWPAPQPTAYAAAIQACQPAGYWPLQETNPPAPAAVEPNLGTLGALGNAYYPDTNPNDVTLGVPGSPAGDSDTAVAFNSSAQPFAFIPHASPALTLQPPFTLEAWFNPATAVYGTILGQGGGGSLNGGPTYGGFQFGWAGANKTCFESQLYKFGLNKYTVFDTPQGYALRTWYHYVLTYDTAGNATMYVNGQPMATANLPYQADSWSPLTIGNGKWNGLSAQRGVNGTIDEVAIYTNLLPPSVIASHYTLGTNANRTTPYQQAVLNANPLLYFRMDCAAFTAPLTVASPVAVNLGSAPVNGAYLPGIIPGAVAGPSLVGLGAAPVAAVGNGIFSCVDLGYAPAFNPTNTQPFSALLWFKGNPADGSMQALMGHGLNSWALNLDGSTGKLVWNSGAGSVSSTSIYNDGNWHQAAGVYDGGQNYLYVDGALAASGAASGTVTGNTNHLYLGGDPDYTILGVNERFFAGALAQAAFFTNALTPVQIQTLYQAAVAPSPPSLGIRNLGGDQVELSWSYGTLQAATNVAGPYYDLSTPNQPWTAKATNGQSFYRVRR